MPVLDLPAIVKRVPGRAASGEPRRLPSSPAEPRPGLRADLDRGQDVRAGPASGLDVVRPEGTMRQSRTSGRAAFGLQDMRGERVAARPPPRGPCATLARS
jgi:hypothetical protein